jgi:hypothetical protein
MKIAVCLIVFNGKPYIDYWLKHYTECEDVDYVVVAEGATANMKDVLKLKHASSTDGTVDVIRGYFQHPKVKFVCSENTYVEKVDQQNAYVDLVPDDTDYIWVADCDEFYHWQDIKLMKQLLYYNCYTFVEFKMWHFWKGTNYVGTGGSGWGYDKEIDRIFAYYPGAKFLNHRPITMTDRNGRSVKEINPLLAVNNPVTTFHYSYVTQRNVYEKMLYYTKTFNRDYINNWYKPVWLAWTHENREEIEAKYSIHPSQPGGKTKKVELNHPIDVSFIL